LSFLKNRSFAVHLNGVKSENYKIPAGVPQGSVLGPILYNIFTSDIPIPNNCFLSAFADDIAIGSTGVLGEDIVNNLQTGMDGLQNFFTKWKIKINSGKTKAIYFTRKRKECFKPHCKLKIEENEIEWVETVKYLGITLDSKLTFKHHINQTVDKVNKTIVTLYPFINKNSYLSVNNKLLIHKTIFQPILLYGAPIWHDCAKTHISRLQVAQNKVLKLMLNLPFYFSTKKLHEKANVDLVDTMAKSIFDKFNNKLQFSDKILVKDLYL